MSNSKSRNMSNDKSNKSDYSHDGGNDNGKSVDDSVTTVLEPWAAVELSRLEELKNWQGCYFENDDMPFAELTEQGLRGIECHDPIRYGHRETQRVFGPIAQNSYHNQ